MVQALGFQHPTFPTHVCKLHLSLYGLKQAPRAWFDRLTAFLSRIGFLCSTFDPFLFIYTYNGHLTLMLIYLDDIIPTENNPSLLSFLVSQLGIEFALKNFGALHFFIDIEVYKCNRDYHITLTKLHLRPLAQRKYARLIFYDHSYVYKTQVPSSGWECRSNHLLHPCWIPLIPHSATTRHSLLSKQACQHMLQPTTQHLKEAKHILGYLKRTMNSKFSISRN